VSNANPTPRRRLAGLAIFTNPNKGTKHHPHPRSILIVSVIMTINSERRPLVNSSSNNRRSRDHFNEGDDDDDVTISDLSTVKADNISPWKKVSKKFQIPSEFRHPTFVSRGNTPPLHLPSAPHPIMQFVSRAKNLLLSIIFLTSVSATVPLLTIPLFHHWSPLDIFCDHYHVRRNQ